MYSLLLRPEPGDRDGVIALLAELGTLGLIEEDAEIRAFFEDHVDPAPLFATYPLVALEARRESPHTPAAPPVENWDPVFIGTRFFLAPPWLSEPAPPGRIRLTMDAAGAFGTGRHESTQLVIEALEDHVAPSDTVLDVGCGSGVLALAARALGAARVIGCDVHSGALLVARNNSALPLFQGSVDAVSTQTADITIANISARVVDALAAELQRVTKPGGLIILAGFIQAQPPKRFRPEAILERNEWQCWLCRPQSVAASLGNAPLQPFSEQWW